MEFGEKLIVYVRPSGTEPKIKFYFMAMEMENIEEAKNLLKRAKEELVKVLDLEE